MNSLMLIKISLRSLAHHKGRSFLTMLGIVIGISTIIATLGIGRGVAKKQQEKIESMGNNFIMITAGNWMARGKVKSAQRKKQLLFTNNDVEYLKNQCKDLAYISPCATDKTIITRDEHHLETDVRSGNADLLTILDRTIEEGSFFTPDHVQYGESVIVLGHKAARALFPQGNAVGQQVTILKTHYRVLGVVKAVPEFWGAADPDLELYVPLKTAQKKINPWKSTMFYMIMISAYTKPQMQKLSSEVTTLLRIRRGICPEAANDFIVHDSAAMAKAAAESSNSLNLFLLFIASVSLLVAGVGVMNIMLVSVTERTREIGIRLSLGATDKLILRQFLFEALTLSLCGGVLGIALGVFGAHAIAYFMKWKVIITALSIICSFIITTGIGIFFGYYPARKASRLNPITALAEH